MKAWFHSVRALVYYSLFDFTARKFGQFKERENLDGPYDRKGSIEDNIHTLSKILLRFVKFDQPIGSMNLNDQAKITLAPEFFEASDATKNEFIYSMRKIQSISELVSERIDIGLVLYANAYFTLGARSIITRWEAEGPLSQIIESKPEISIRIVINQIVRALLATSHSNSVEKRLDLMDSFNLLSSMPNSKLARDKIKATITILKEVENVERFASLDRILRSPFLQL